MVAKLKSQEDWKKEDTLRMESAILEINNSSNLRYFFRSLLASVAATGTPGGDDAYQLALNVGRHQVGTEIINLFTGYQPALYGTMLIEDAKETESRANTQEEPEDVY